MAIFQGHPDKVCDQISDAILDALLEQDKESRVAVETAIKDNLVFIFGEVTTTASLNYKAIAKTVLKDIDYDEDFVVIEQISKQSPDIALGVNKTDNKEQGAGDQGIMFGYACNETQEFMPLPIMLAHEISKEVDRVRKEQYAHIFGPDGKCQVSVDYKDGKPVNIPIIVVSAQTKPGVYREVYEEIIRQAILRAVGRHDLLNGTQILINPTGEFIIGGPKADSGLTGRKIIVDTYGGYSRHGGGAFSGKDVSKVDRSAALLCKIRSKGRCRGRFSDTLRSLFKLCNWCCRATSILINTFDTGVTSDQEISQLVYEVFDFRLGEMKKELKLDNVKFKQVATYGHFGREDLDVPWEDVDHKIEELLELYEEA